ncbi:antifreeze protein [Brucella sp. IR073]|uniref:antifreeze protein n=1 Tax=unclassified Brucella TaxID=2632610 RepID=UPI003B982C9A
MLIRSIASLAGAAVILGAAALTASSPANALTMKECSVKYKAAKEAGTLGGVKWNDFRKTQCEGDAAAAAPAAPAGNNNATAGGAAAGAAAGTAAAAAGAKGLSRLECAAKYEAAKISGSLNGMNWNAFRKAECGPGADATALSTDGDREPAAPTMRAPTGVSFPTAISPKFANEKPAKARMHTCLEQYYANKEANTLGGLKWIQKGGGFYSLCNARLKQTS